MSYDKTTLGSILGRGGWAKLREKGKKNEEAAAAAEKEVRAKEKEKRDKARKPHVNEKLRKHKERY